jgi:hypothetical protein
VTSGRKAISATIDPWPSHAVQRPPEGVLSARLRQTGEQLSDLVPDAEKRRGHGPRRPTDRRLVDGDRTLHDLGDPDRIERARRRRRQLQILA